MEVKAIVLDFDGTVYFQKPVQIYNLLRIILAISVKPRVVSDIRIIQKYRRMRERYSDSNLPILRVEDDLAAEVNMSVDKIRLLRDYWLIDSQSLAIQIFQRNALLRKISQLQRQGVAIILWSDYPTAEKSKRLKLHPDVNLCSEDPRIRFAKPSAEGLFYVIESLKLKTNEVILIGDRDDRDGKAAAAAGINYYKIGRDANQILDLMLARLVGTG
jgi:HAD superfamily hydrolase (TIGR01549 family)